MTSLITLPTKPHPLFLPACVYHENQMSLNEKTLCMTARQNCSVHYNVHSLYGFGETNHTML